jgi:hypothetical protein
MRLIFSMLLFFHGIIHLAGFIKSFGIRNIPQLTVEISKQTGVLWLFVALLFVIAALCFLLQKNWWVCLSLPAVLISQVLITMAWQDAKYGSIANLIILFVVITAMARIRFDKMVQKEVIALWESPIQESASISEENLIDLPPVIQRWLKVSGVVGKPAVQDVRLKQTGQMRLKENSKWMTFTATQYFSVEKPQFVWQTTVQLLPLISLNGRDKFLNGEGHLLINLFSLFRVAKAGNNSKMNSATLIRYLAETSWFPSAALCKYIRWAPIDLHTAKATINFSGVEAEGVFHFNANGDFTRFTADRYMTTGIDAKPEKWLVEVTGYKEFNGYRIPHKNKVTWQLQTGDFNWANIEITSIEFNTRKIYS